jgi:hypothetical protein
MSKQFCDGSNIISAKLKASLKPLKTLRDASCRLCPYVEIKHLIPSFEFHTSPVLSPVPLHKITSEPNSGEEENLDPIKK